MRKLPVYECLIISPGDVVEERRAVAEEIMRWNGTSGRAVGAIVAPVMWEAHARPTQAASAQETINEQLVDDCDFGIAIFWSRLGTPTSTSASGSVEEIDRLKAQEKDVLIYFNTASIPQPVDIEELRRLDDYQRTIAGLTGRFANCDELRGRFHADLTTLVTEQLSTQSTRPNDASGSARNPGLKMINRIPLQRRGSVAVRWFAYRDHANRDKYTNAEMALERVDEEGNTVNFENKGGPRTGIIRVPLGAVQDVWSDAPEHWSVRISGRIDSNDLSYSP